jgi:hypothetical protein
MNDIYYLQSFNILLNQSNQILIFNLTLEY